MDPARVGRSRCVWSNAEFLATRDCGHGLEAFLSVVLSRWFGILLLIGGLAWLVFAASRPVAAGAAVAGGVVLRSPQPGSRVPSRFVVEGLAATFEHNVIVERRAGREWVLLGGPTTTDADEYGMGLGPRFRIELTLPPGRHRLRVGDYVQGDGREGEFGPEFDVDVRA